MNAVVQMPNRHSMIVVELEQGSPEWLSWRDGGIGASESATVMGENPYQTPAQLWAIKVGLTPAPDLSNNPHVQRGVRNEPKARERFEEEFGEFAVPLTAEHPEHRFIRASFDGILSNGLPLEIKCPAERRLQAVRAFAANAPVGTQLVIGKEEMDAMTLGHYYAQLQQQMLVADTEAAVFYVYDVENEAGYAFWVSADPEYQARLVEALKAFWDCVLTRTEPPLDPERDVFQAESLLAGADPFALESDHPYLRWQQAESAWYELDAQIKALEAEVKKLKADRGKREAEMISLMGENVKAEGLSGLKIARFTQQGRVDYKAAITDLVPDVTDEVLDHYRKDPSTGVRFTAPKKGK